MNETIAARVSDLADMGWRVTSHTESSAALETRTPFNWLLFAVSVLLFLGVGGALYVGFWLLTSKAHVFLADGPGGVAASGDVWLVERQELDRVAALALTARIRQRGFWSVMWPSIVGLVASVAIWGLLIWGFVSLID